MALSPEMMKLVSQAKNKYAGNAGNTVKPAEGRNTYRIIPKLFGSDIRFWRDLGVHWIKATPDGKPLAVVGCSSVVYDQPSMIETAIDMAIASAIDEDSKKHYESMRARKSVLINVVDRKDGSVNVLELTPTTFGKILDLMQLYGAEGQDILDAATGADIVITRTGKGLNTNYDVAIAPLVPGKPHAPVTKDQMDKATDLDDFIARNFFKGEENKALNAISQIAGIVLPRAGSLIGASTPTPALTSSATAVADATVTQPVVQTAPVATAPVEEDPIEKRRRELQAEMEALQRQSAGAAPAAPVQAAPVAEQPMTGAALSSADEEALLRELEGL